jgi:hypothetical protein
MILNVEYQCWPVLGFLQELSGLGLGFFKNGRPFDFGSLKYL